MNTLQIIGLCLLAPFLVSIVAISCWGIVKKIKEKPIETITCIFCIMAIAGAFLFLIGM